MIVQGTIYQINIKPQSEDKCGLPKDPVDDVLVTKQGLEGDYNHHRYEEKPDDLDKAVLIFPLENIVELNNDGWPDVKPGHIGENFTLEGIPYDYLVEGRRYLIGEVEIQISEAAIPCVKLTNLSYVGKKNKAAFSDALKGRRGWYARVLKEGIVRKGDTIRESIYGV